MILFKKLDENIDSYFDTKYKFQEIFNRKTGFYARSGILETGMGEEFETKTIDTGIDPFMRSAPNLLDIGIRGAECEAGKAGVCYSPCYQNRGSRHNKDMTLEDYETIMKYATKRVQQVALGGSADPCLHKNFKEILYLSKKYNIVPSYTTSGYMVDDKIVELTKEYCGAVAISWERKKEIRDAAIYKFIDAGVTTNIHFVVGKDSIDEAIDQLRFANGSYDPYTDNDQYTFFPEGINAVIFLMYKGIGLGDKAKMLTVDDPRVKTFYELVDNFKGPFQIGLDACSVPGLINNSENIDRNSISSCDGSTFSAYIDANLIMYPCSFGIHNPDKYGVNLRTNTMDEVWNSNVFDNFRNKLSNSCPGCKDRNDCRGGCPILNSMTLCNRKERDSY